MYLKGNPLETIPLNHALYVDLLYDKPYSPISGQDEPPPPLTMTDPADEEDTWLERQAWAPGYRHCKL